MANLVVQKKVKNGVLYTNGMIRIDCVRASYPHLDKPYKGDDDKAVAKYGILGLLDKKTHKEIKDIIVERINELLKENKGAKVAADKKFIKNGDDAGKEECEGMWTVSAREERRPSVRDAEGTSLSPEEAKEICYAGSYVDILIRPWFQDNKFGKRVNAGLVAVKFRKDGEPFGEGRVDDSEAWDEDDNGGDGFSSDEDDDL